MERIELITSKEYWVEALETLRQQGHTNFDIATVIANRMEEAINYTPCCTELKCEGCKKPLDSGLCGNCCSDLASGNY